MGIKSNNKWNVAISGDYDRHYILTIQKFDNWNVAMSGDCVRHKITNT